MNALPLLTVTSIVLAREPLQVVESHAADHQSTTEASLLATTCGLDLARDPARIVVELAGADFDLAPLVARHGGLYQDARPFGALHRVIELGQELDHAGQQALVDGLSREDGIAYASAAQVDGAGELCFPTRSILIRFHSQTPRPLERSMLQMRPGVRIVEENFGLSEHGYRLETDLRTGDQVFELVRSLAGDPRVATVQPDRGITLRHSDCDTDDCLFPFQWNLENTGQDNGAGAGVPGMDVNVSSVWCFHEGDPGVNVMILDSGVQMDHPDIRISGGFDFTNLPSSPAGAPGNACDNHGTPVAGVVSGRRNNLDFVTGVCGSGHMLGVAPGVSSYSARIGISVVPCNNTSNSMTSWVVSAIALAGLGTARVTNASFETAPDQSIEDVYDAAAAAGVIHIAASGNGSAPQNEIPFPASHASVFAVGLIGDNGFWGNTTNYGPEKFCVAPGLLLRLQDRLGGAGYNSPADEMYVGSGTSYAAPHVAGLAALMISANPLLTVLDFELVMIYSCRDQIWPDQFYDPPGRDNYYGYGLVDASAAMLQMGNRYVDLSAQTGGDGSPATPYQQVGQATTSVGFARRVYVQPGTYNETLTVTNRMELHSAGGPVVIR